MRAYKLSTFAKILNCYNHKQTQQQAFPFGTLDIRSTTTSPHDHSETNGTYSQLATMSSEQPQTKKFQKGERLITPAAQKASKYYPAEDVAAPKTVRIFPRL